MSNIDRIAFEELPDDLQGEIVDWLELPETQEQLDGLESIYTGIMEECGCDRDEAVQRHFCNVMDIQPESMGTGITVKRRKPKK